MEGKFNSMITRKSQDPLKIKIPCVSPVFLSVVTFTRGTQERLKGSQSYKINVLQFVLSIYCPLHPQPAGYKALSEAVTDRGVQGQNQDLPYIQVFL